MVNVNKPGIIQNYPQMQYLSWPPVVVTPFNFISLGWCFGICIYSQPNLIENLNPSKNPNLT